jgi:hypothetical protein
MLVLAIAALENTASMAQAQQGACASISSAAERLMCYDRERCAAIASDAERLACYDRIQPAPVPATTPAPAATAPAPAPAAAAAGAGAAAATAGASSTPAAGTAVSTTQGDRVTAPVSPQASAAAGAESPLSTRPREPAATAPPAPIAPDVGAHVEPSILPIVVVGTRALPGRPVEFVTENGQVWVQTDSQRTQLPDTPFDAQLKPGAMGSTFLVPTDHRAIRVRLRN